MPGCLPWRVGQGAPQRIKKMAPTLVVLLGWGIPRSRLRGESTPAGAIGFVDQGACGDASPLPHVLRQRLQSERPGQSIGPGRRVAMREIDASGERVPYLLGDHLNSTALTLNSSGRRVAELRYRAFGETRYNGTPSGTPTTEQDEATDGHEPSVASAFSSGQWFCPPANTPNLSIADVHVSQQPCVTVSAARLGLCTSRRLPGRARDDSRAGSGEPGRQQWRGQSASRLYPANRPCKNRLAIFCGQDLTSASEYGILTYA